MGRYRRSIPATAGHERQGLNGRATDSGPPGVSKLHARRELPTVSRAPPAGPTLAIMTVLALPPRLSCTRQSAKQCHEQLQARQLAQADKSTEG